MHGPLPPLVLGEATVLHTNAARKGGKGHRGVLEAAERFIDRWHTAVDELCLP